MNIIVNQLNYGFIKEDNCTINLCCSVVAITTAQLHSSKSEFRSCAGSHPARGMSEIHDGKDL